MQEGSLAALSRISVPGITIYNHGVVPKKTAPVFGRGGSEAGRVALAYFRASFMFSSILSRNFWVVSQG